MRGSPGCVRRDHVHSPGEQIPQRGLRRRADLITDRVELAPVRAGLEIAVQIRRLFESQWKAKAYGGLLGDEAVLQALLDGETAPGWPPCTKMS